MFKIFKYLKESWISIIIIVLLLCIQAWCDLELPNYTSKIVNVGIQQGGIESSNEDVIKMIEILKQSPQMQNQNDSIIE